MAEESGEAARAVPGEAEPPSRGSPSPSRGETRLHHSPGDAPATVREEPGRRRVVRKAMTLDPHRCTPRPEGPLQHPAKANARGWHPLVRDRGVRPHDGATRRREAAE